MVASKLKPVLRTSSKAKALKLIQGSMSARSIERRSPWLAGLHRVSTGALIGMGLSMVGLSGLTLHWQHQWAISYGQLEATKGLEHRLQESSALLEQHHLSSVKEPKRLVPTSSEKLIHMPEPNPVKPAVPTPLNMLASLQASWIPAGY